MLETMMSQSKAAVTGVAMLSDYYRDAQGALSAEKLSYLNSLPVAPVMSEDIEVDST